jgi:ArsR family transcriptional regulator
MNTNSSNKYSAFFRNLSNPLKADILAILKLKQAGLSVNEISESLKVEQSKISHALTGLRKCKIVEVTRLGKQRVYSLNTKTMLPILQIIDAHAKENCSNKCWNCVGCSQ